MEGSGTLQKIQLGGPIDWAFGGGQGWGLGFWLPCLYGERGLGVWESGRKSSGGHLIGGAFETPTDV